MEVFFTVTLVVSIVGLFTLVSIKRWELTSGKVVWASVRPAVGEFLHQRVVFVERVLPALVVGFAGRVWRGVRALAHAAVAWVVLFIERGLESTLHIIRHKTSTPPKHQKSSDFLREVAEHKRKLQASDEPGAIFED